MNDREFKTCYRLATRGEYSLDNLDQFDGFGLPDYQKRICAAVDFAGLIIWQCGQFNGGIDSAALQELYQHRRLWVLAENADVDAGSVAMPIE
jgi:hypothetical protein